MDKWSYKKNAKKPTEYLSNSRAVVWWECEKGHSWKRAINAEVNYDGCPVCTERVLVKGENDLATLYPDFVQEWDYERNEKDPSEFTRTSKARAWWKCKECGHEWQAVIYNRIMAQTGCPKCGYSKKMQTTRKQTLVKSGHTLAKEFPELLLEWDYDKNTLNPAEISPGANYKVWWKCKKGHSYQAWLNDRTGKRKTGCPYCAGKRKLKEP